MRKLIFFDTTLRDGEQCPGFSMTTDEKIRLALQLERLGVDVIEAGFPASSSGDFEAVQKISSLVKNSSICGLSRANKKDIEAVYEATKNAARPRIHTFIATSDIHMKHKLKKSREEVVELAREAVRFARNLCDDVEFSAEDALRSDPDFLYQIIDAVIKEGAGTINLPDTVGYIMPDEIYALFSGIKNNVANIDKVVLSTHNHDDLGMGVANSLAAIRAGADQVECTINGIGERAGNSALEEICMAINVRKDFYKDIETTINTTEIYKTSRMITSITGVDVQPNKAVVGKNAFAHESGIHQDGVLKERTTYEIMTAESVGIMKNSLVLGKHSGRAAFKTRLAEMGYNLDNEHLEKAFSAFKDLADKKKEIFDEDLEAIILGKLSDAKKYYELDYVGFNSGSSLIATATLRLKKDDGTILTDSSTGEGPVDAAFKAVERISGCDGRLKNYKINAVTQGKDAQGEVTVIAEFASSGIEVLGKGYSTDVLIASVEAYINALNNYISRIEK
ncbi:2-isopropylmalate synthase [Mucispirillum schaedleri]|jgi:2-isopropylmalate synthase|uniref:2-isopropylmalate synthase n=1 Tax=Mucispirillum schaedleri ASF457 TaxID=1379858 RepID=V2QC51_9BACT|nr:2-isopropylmalate synthase [Mucispirillum schaedleri]MCX4361126.1 2-isopropylmalate synthase [Mucispirillum schaedleri]USF24213.1 2-isopropylmalate synthase [Mucispirillum schaedleri ASF457]SIW06075.1 2-isopropylmalate synthase [Mucispirillum schaedleri ASF457]